MFENLSDKLHGVFKKLRGETRLSEANIADAMREIRLALIDADVNLEIATEFVAAVKEKCIGQEVLKSVTPAQQVVIFSYTEVNTIRRVRRPIRIPASPRSSLPRTVTVLRVR